MALATTTDSAPAKAGQQTLHSYLMGRMPAIQQAAASHLNPTRLLRIVVANVQKTPALKGCSFDSIFRCTVQAAELGLEPGSAIGDAYLVPYKAECQLIPGYRGLIKLAYRSGFVASVMSTPVYQGDTFEFELGLTPKLRHVPNPDGKREPDLITYVYCVVHLKDGGYLYDVMTRGEVDNIRRRSKASNSGPWVTDYAEMARKTVVRRCLKYAPMSVELQKAVAMETLQDAGESVEAEFEYLDPVPEEEPQTKSSALADQIGGPTHVDMKDAPHADENGVVDDAWPAPVFGEPFDTELRTLGMPLQEAKDWESNGWDSKRLKLALAGAKGDLEALRATLNGGKG